MLSIPPSPNSLGKGADEVLGRQAGYYDLLCALGPQVLHKPPYAGLTINFHFGRALNTLSQAVVVYAHLADLKICAVRAMHKYSQARPVNGLGHVGRVSLSRHDAQQRQGIPTASSFPDGAISAAALARQTVHNARI